MSVPPLSSPSLPLILTPAPSPPPLPRHGLEPLRHGDKAPPPTRWDEIIMIVTLFELVGRGEAAARGEGGRERRGRDKPTLPDPANKYLANITF